MPARPSLSITCLRAGRSRLGYGATDDGAIYKVGEETDARGRAARVEEGLQILTGLWSPEPFSYHGDHY